MLSISHLAMSSTSHASAKQSDCPSWSGIKSRMSTAPSSMSSDVGRCGPSWQRRTSHRVVASTSINSSSVCRIRRRLRPPPDRPLDLSHTLVPGWVKLTQPGVPDKHAALWSLARLSFPEARVEALSQPPIPSPLHQASLPPDEQLLCFDYLYYTSVASVCASPLVS